MKYLPDYKKEALDALRNSWPAALICSLISTIFGGGYSVEYDMVDINATKEVSSSQLEQYLRTFTSSNIWPYVQVFLVVAAAVSVILAIVSLAVGGALEIGHSTFNLKLIDRRNPQAADLFSALPRFLDGLCMKLLRGLYIFLWSLLLIIPGLVKSLAYYMTPYIMAENPGMKASQAIKESDRIMMGHKWDLFFLHLSFFGWMLLTGLPSAIAAVVITNNVMGVANPLSLLVVIPLMILSFAGGVALNAYMTATDAAFYRSITAPAYMEYNQPFGEYNT